MDQNRLSKLSWSKGIYGFLAVVLTLAACVDRVSAADSRLEAQEEAGYAIWWKKFRRFEEPARNAPRVEDDPNVPFNVAQMYTQSDIVLECALGNYLTATDHLKLVVRISDIGGVYKGQIPVTALEPEKTHLQLCVMQDELASHHSFVRLQSDEKSRYLLFLKKVGDDERQLRGYGGLKATLFKVYRVWQGAIRLDGRSYLNGDANSQIVKDKRFKGIPLSPPDVLDGVKLAGASGAAREGALTRVAWESRYLDALAGGENGAVRETVPDDFKNVPVDVLETFTAEILRSRLAACKEPEKKQALAARLRFRAKVWKDLATIVPE